MIKIIYDGTALESEIFARKKTDFSLVEKTVENILSDVRENGDNAVRRYTEKFDGISFDDFLVSPAEIEKAFAETDKEYIKILKEAKENIEFYHEKQKRQGFRIEKQSGIVIGQKITPLKRVGIYVPGGTASYPSTVLMNVIPAKIAGVKEIILTTPCGKNGIRNEILVAASLCGADKIYKIGGAQAIAALAYGTETIPKVDKITGPGNIYVATAKKLVFGEVAIDMIAGPSEILVIADNSANPDFIAADMLSQAEHDKLAEAVLITDSAQLAEKVAKRIEVRLNKLERCEIAATSIDNNGKIIVTDNLERAIEVSNKIAPEHLELCVENPFDTLEKIENAGSVFLGNNTPEALGDYFAGPNHTLPTGGTAKFSSPLSVDDFIKKSSYLYYTKSEIEKIGKSVMRFANSEGLTAHEQSVRARLEK